MSFDWRIQLSKQTKLRLRPTIFNCEITPVSFGSACWIQQSQWVLCTAILRHVNAQCMCLAVTLLRYQRHAHADVFTQLAIVLFGWNEKCNMSDSACNSTFICYHVTYNPPIKWQGSAWVLYKWFYWLLTNFCWTVIFCAEPFSSPLCFNPFSTKCSKSTFVIHSLTKQGRKKSQD